MCGGLDPDRAFSVPHTAESARQTSASTTSARERQYPQSGDEPSTVAAPPRDRAACSGACCPNSRGALEETAINQHPPTTAVGILGTRSLPRLPGEVQRTSADQSPETLGATGAFMQYSRQEGGEATEKPKMMRGSHALLCLTPARDPQGNTQQERVPDGDAGLGGYDDDLTWAPEKTNQSSRNPLENRGNAGHFFVPFSAPRARKTLLEEGEMPAIFFRPFFRSSCA